MAIQLQIRRGTTAENDVFTGAVGELTMDTDTNGVRVHDGTTAGGVKIPTEATADYVVEWQPPTDLNNYTWYRKYKSGWVEQGGNVSYNSSSVTFPVEFADTGYYFNANLDNGGTGTTLHIISSSYTTVGCVLKEGQSGTAQRALTANAKWFACGMAA